MNIQICGAVCVALFVAAGAVAQDASPSKEQIIKALNTPPEATTRGFVQVPGAQPAAPAATSATARTPAAAAPTGGAHASIGVPILFDLNSADIKAESHDTLAAIADALNSPSLKSAHILIEGHTDGRGSAELNQNLSQDRAASVRRYLVETGKVSSERLATVGKGANEPVDPAKPLAPENRRVVLVNLDK